MESLITADCPWVSVAMAKLGTKALENKGDPVSISSEVRRFLQSTGSPPITLDGEYGGHVGWAEHLHPHVTHWCSAFVNYCMIKVGMKGTDSAAARSWLHWGEILLRPRFGCVAVFKRGKDPALGHVGFWLGEENESIVLLGGNQGNPNAKVSIARWHKKNFLGYRWPAQSVEPRGVLV